MGKYIGTCKTIKIKTAREAGGHLTPGTPRILLEKQKSANYNYQADKTTNTFHTVMGGM